MLKKGTVSTKLWSTRPCIDEAFFDTAFCAGSPAAFGLHLGPRAAREKTRHTQEPRKLGHEGPSKHLLNMPWIKNMDVCETVDIAPQNHHFSTPEGAGLELNIDPKSFQHEKNPTPKEEQRKEASKIA